MTDKERKKLVERLRSLEDHPWELTKQAADEIERLADRVQILETAAALNLQQAEQLAAENDELRKEVDVQ